MLPLRWPLLLLLLLPLHVGCGDPSARLIGHWQAQLADPPGKDADFKTRMEYQIVSAFKIAVEFKADGTATFRGSIPGNSYDVAGTWKHVKTEGNTSVVELDWPDFGKSETTITWIDSNHIEWRPPNLGADSKPMRFERITTAAAK